jgi:hypothetical protein
MEIASPAAIVTLTEADLVLSVWLVAVMLNVAGLGTVAGAVYVTDNPDPLIVPYVELPFVTPFTDQVTAVLEVPDTAAVIVKVALTCTVCAVVGLLMETATTGGGGVLTDSPPPPHETATRAMPRGATRSSRTALPPRPSSILPEQR